MNWAGSRIPANFTLKAAPAPNTSCALLSRSGSGSACQVDGCDDSLQTVRPHSGRPDLRKSPTSLSRYDSGQMPNIVVANCEPVPFRPLAVGQGFSFWPRHDSLSMSDSGLKSTALHPGAVVGELESNRRGVLRSGPEPETGAGLSPPPIRNTPRRRSGRRPW
jgi:hypothetical protein